MKHRIASLALAALLSLAAAPQAPAQEIEYTAALGASWANLRPEAEVDDVAENAVGRISPSAAGNADTGAWSGYASVGLRLPRDPYALELTLHHLGHYSTYAEVHGDGVSANLSADYNATAISATATRDWRDWYARAGVHHTRLHVVGKTRVVTDQGTERIGESWTEYTTGAVVGLGRRFGRTHAELTIFTDVGMGESTGGKDHYALTIGRRF